MKINKNKISLMILLILANNIFGSKPNNTTQQTQTNIMQKIKILDDEIHLFESEKAIITEKKTNLEKEEKELSVLEKQDPKSTTTENCKKKVNTLDQEIREAQKKLDQSAIQIKKLIKDIENSKELNNQQFYISNVFNNTYSKLENKLGDTGAKTLLTVGLLITTSLIIAGLYKMLQNEDNCNDDDLAESI